ncbi:MAG: carboxypeptidase-like regulatory domain-containing protein [Thermoguttaceae bacterium]|jgi:hypothetical protein|nr:carboxypeptidase-like regulatory domain-containing protein [Thermoguttaceae bacterium]
MRANLSEFFRPGPFGGCAVAVGVLLLSGCGPSRPTTYPVRGTVTLDGQPVAEAQVMLMPEDDGRPGQGITDASGRFTIGTFTSSDGALPGRHAVTVVSRRISGVGTDPDGLEGDIAPGGVKVEWLVPQRYSSPKTSGITVDVAKGMSPLDIQLQSP